MRGGDALAVSKTRLRSSKHVHRATAPSSSARESSLRPLRCCRRRHRRCTLVAGRARLTPTDHAARDEGPRRSSAGHGAQAGADRRRHRHRQQQQQQQRRRRRRAHPLPLPPLISPARPRQRPSTTPPPPRWPASIACVRRRCSGRMESSRSVRSCCSARTETLILCRTSVHRYRPRTARTPICCTASRRRSCRPT